MGASEDDLHALVDSFVADLNDRFVGEEISREDPGRGTPDEPIGAVQRAAVIARLHDETERDWLASLRGKTVLVVGEFPPHLLEELLANEIKTIQIHPTDDEGYAPPHFYHLAPHGLRGITDLNDLADIQCDLVIVEGAVVDSRVWVSILVPIVLRMFAGVEKALLEADHVAPHMQARLSVSDFDRIPLTA